MTEINSDRVNTLQEKFTFTFKRFVEHHNQQIIDQLIKQRKKNSFDPESQKPYVSGGIARANIGPRKSGFV